LHCDLLQGFLLSRPVAPEQIPALTGTTHTAFGMNAGMKSLPSRIPAEPLQTELIAS